MSHKHSIIAALLIGWVSGAGSWYVITKDQDTTGEQGQGDAPSAALNPSVDESGGERLAVFPPPVGAGNPPAVSARATLPPVLHAPPLEMPTPLMAAEKAMGVFLDDGVVQDTGEFIDADDPQAYIAHLNARSDDDTVQDSGEFIDVDNPPMHAGSDSLPQDSGEFIDADDPQAYTAYWDGRSDGVVHDTGEFIAIDPRSAPFP
ncbi:MAG TPA: hypothetical protein ENI94_14320 [Gammaproteobacteria bacterium]|nr:hypothetical protein [Gammaproteobacteria bacterium]